MAYSQRYGVRGVCTGAVCWRTEAWAWLYGGCTEAWRLLRLLRRKQKLLGFLAMLLFWAMGYWVRLFWVGLSNWAEV
ncbi:hypothetical protein ES319_A03G158800v1 [Gossypium barbadense]|uniref:Uncharacterized protein n=2 Tax=Gossypium TaxID=3633 RepID=A0A5J5WGH3_GOSBA|nr:hypothetical protein ES319_A03G158800v1 [Gossypium barbadense]TYH25579.1 hypothetical protein ES288_A03G180400v1 [Gossypium darwinii]